MLMSIEIQTAPTFTSNQPKALFRFRYEQSGHDYAVLPDGEHFLCIKEPDIGPAQVEVVLNWATELIKR